MKENVAKEVKELIDVYIIPAIKVEAAKMIYDHMKEYHRSGPGISMSIGGVEFNIKETK
jgi:hypothetical protein